MKTSASHAEPQAVTSEPRLPPRSGIRWTPPGQAPDWAVPAPGPAPDPATGRGAERAPASGSAPGAPHDTELDADRAAARVLRLSPPGALRTPMAPGRVLSAIRGGQPLTPAQRARYEPGFGADLGHVRLHADAPAASSARSVGARAYTLGADIVFGHGQYRPGDPLGDRLLAHELAHVVQQTTPAQPGPVALRTPAPVLARSADEWLAGSVDLARYSGRYSALLAEIDELQAWRERQTASSADTQRIDEVLAMLRGEQARLERAAQGASPPRRGQRPGGSVDAGAAPLPERLPRVLAERRSAAITDAAELRTEVDLVMQWLARNDLPREDRQLLLAERAHLQPLLQADRRRVAADQQARRLQTALAPTAGTEAEALAALATAIQGIAADPADPRIAYLHHGGQRLVMSAEQARQLRSTLATTLSRSIGQVASGAQYYWSRYQAQRALNRESPVIARISGWLADVTDPREELRARCRWVGAQVAEFKAELAAGALVAAAARLPLLEQAKQEIALLASAYYEGHIEGAGIAAHRLELTRDTAFTIAASIAAVLAAPVVAGAVAYGVGAVGVTGTVATVTTGVGTTLGSGAVVGVGMATLRGGSAAVGQLASGGSRAQVASALLAEGGRGLREGFMAGATAGAARFIGPAMGVGKDVALQTARRIAADTVVNGLSAMVDVLLQGGSVGQAAQAGAIGALSAIPGALLGGSNNALVKGYVGPFLSAATAYVAARAGGASPQEAIEAAGIALTTQLAMAHAAPGSKSDADRERQGETWARDLHATLEPKARSGATPPGTAPPQGVAPSAVDRRSATDTVPDQGTPEAQPRAPATTGPDGRGPAPQQADGSVLHPADPSNAVEAFKLYKARIAADPAREVALVYNHTLDQWAVVQGGPGSVSMAGLRAAGWQAKDRTLARHSHPVHGDGRTSAPNLLPSGEGADLSVVRADAAKRAGPDANLHVIDVVTTRGPDRTLVAFDPATQRWTVDYPGGAPGGGRDRLSFATSAEYHAWFRQRFGFDPGAAPRAARQPLAPELQAPSRRTPPATPPATQGEAQARLWRDKRPAPGEVQALQAELGATGPVSAGALLQLYRHGSRATVVKALRKELHHQAQDPASKGVLTLGEHQLTLDPATPAGPQIDAFIRKLEGAHSTPQSVSKKLPPALQKALPGGKANPDDALVVLTDKATHTRMDQPWKDAFDKLRRSGTREATGQQVLDEVADGIRRTEGLSEAERAARVARLGDEFRELGIRPDGRYAVPAIVKWWEWRARRGAVLP